MIMRAEFHIALKCQAPWASESASLANRPWMSLSSVLYEIGHLLNCSSSLSSTPLVLCPVKSLVACGWFSSFPEISVSGPLDGVSEFPAKHIIPRVCRCAHCPWSATLCSVWWVPFQKTKPCSLTPRKSQLFTPHFFFSFAKLWNFNWKKRCKYLLAPPPQPPDVRASYRGLEIQSRFLRSC